MSNEKKSAFSKSDIAEIVIKATIVAVVLALFGWGFVMIFNQTKDVVDDFKTVSLVSEIEDNVRAGEIVDKYTVDGHTTKSGNTGLVYNPSSGNVGVGIGIGGGSTTYVPMQYILSVSYSYDYEGTTYIGTKAFEVERDVYLAYEIGEWYDSQNSRSVEVTEE